MDATKRKDVRDMHTRFAKNRGEWIAMTVNVEGDVVSSHAVAPEWGEEASAWVRNEDAARAPQLVQEVRDLRGACEELASELLEVRAQRDGVRGLLGSVYRRLRDGREVSPSQMEALRICYDRRRSLPVPPSPTTREDYDCEPLPPIDSDDK